MPLLTPEEARARVARGMELLDRVEPGWREHIHLDSLNMGMACSCVLGQAFGNYSDGLDELFERGCYSGYERRSFSEQHGFDVELLADHVHVRAIADVAADFRMLRQAWEEALSKPKE